MEKGLKVLFPKIFPKSFLLAPGGQAVLIPERRELPTAGRRSTRMNVEEKIYGGVPAEAEVLGKGLGSGRKMMIKRDMGLVKDEGLKGDDLTIKGTAANSVGIQNRSCKLRIRAVPRPMDRDVKMAGFVAFNADYHVPKPHPPKNN
ncbi:hypothetical protein I3843_15G095100 [Carya illinoinensis]|nr:hypothetical protein I3843_15G095100 [Carya illinoinensis]